MHPSFFIVDEFKMNKKRFIGEIHDINLTDNHFYVLFKFSGYEKNAVF